MPIDTPAQGQAFLKRHIASAIKRARPLGLAATYKVEPLSNPSATKFDRPVEIRTARLGEQQAEELIGFRRAQNQHFNLRRYFSFLTN